jgi:hypothetical protein
MLLALWCEDDGQDIAEYAVMLAVILILAKTKSRQDALQKTFLVF